MIKLTHSNICDNCKSENHFYSLNCSHCNSFLRARIPNIDLWETVWNLFYSPVKTAEKIIYADSKNYLFSFLLLLGFKNSVSHYIISHALFNEGETIIFFSHSLIRGGFFSIIFFLSIVYFITKLNQIFGLNNRYRDNLAIYTYSFTPVLLGFVFLLPIQYALYGKFWFTFNPSPFIIKESAAYILYTIEFLLFFWTCLIFIASTYAQTRNKLYSFIIGSILFVFLSWSLFWF